MCQSPIANIDISKDYDESLGTDDVHYQSFARMAAFWPRHAGAPPRPVFSDAFSRHRAD